MIERAMDQQLQQDITDLLAKAERTDHCQDDDGQRSSVLADTGYVNTDAMDRLEEAGVEPYVAVSRNESHSQRRNDYRPRSVTEKAPKTVKDPRLLVMQEKLQTEAGRKLYAKRKQTVEPVFGIIKSAMGFRQFLLRGLEKVSGKWDLVCLAYNVKRLWALKTALIGGQEPPCARPAGPQRGPGVQARARTSERTRTRHGSKRSGIALGFCPAVI